MGEAILLIIGAVATGLYGASIWTSASTVMHQQVAAGIFVVSAVLLVGGFISSVVHALPKRIALAQARQIHGAAQQAAVQAHQARTNQAPLG